MSMPPEQIIAENAQRLWEQTVAIWTTPIVGANVGEVVIAAVLIGGTIFFRGRMSLWIIDLVKRFFQKSPSPLTEEWEKAVRGPSRLLAITLGFYLAFAVLGLTTPGTIWARISVSTTTASLFWFAFNAIVPLSTMLRRNQRGLSPVINDWGVKSVQVVLVLVGVASVLEIWGIPVAPIIGGLGLFGVAVSLGAQDIFKNLFAGVSILSEKRFLPGDWIKVDGVVEGTVEHIHFRSTVVRRFDKGPVYVPNADLANNSVTNFSRMTHRRIYWLIGVRYDATVEQLQTIRDETLDFILNHPEFAKPPEVSTFMRVDRFGPSSIDFMLYSFTRTTNWGEWLRLKEELAFKLKEVVEGAGTGFAYPSTTMYVETGAEVYQPPSGDGPKPGTAAASASDEEAILAIKATRAQAARLASKATKKD